MHNRKRNKKHIGFKIANTIACFAIFLSLMIQPIQTAMATTEDAPALTIRTENLANLRNAMPAVTTPSAIIVDHGDKDRLKPKTKPIKPTEYYSICSLNVRSVPKISKNNVLTVLYPYQKVTVVGKNADWYEIKIKNKTGYVSHDYLIKASEIKTKTFTLPIKDNQFKSWMPYTAITNKASKQYKLQHAASTGRYGIRMYNGRYCVALGTYFDMQIGTYFDLILGNNTVIPCVISDIKSDQHTKSNRIQTAHDGSMVEFIVDSKRLDKKAKSTGNISKCCASWDAPIIAVVQYN